MIKEYDMEEESWKLDIEYLKNYQWLNKIINIDNFHIEIDIEICEHRKTKKLYWVRRTWDQKTMRCWIETKEFTKNEKKAYHENEKRMNEEMMKEITEKNNVNSEDVE